jgi:hypothetical protein
VTRAPMASSCSLVMTTHLSGPRWLAIMDCPLHLSGDPGCLPNCGHRNASMLFLDLGTKELRSRERASNCWSCSPEACGRETFVSHSRTER